MRSWTEFSPHSGIQIIESALGDQVRVGHVRTVCHHPPSQGAPRRAALIAAVFLALPTIPSCRKDSQPDASTVPPPSAGAKTSAIQETRPDVLLVTIDTFRADHCSLYGYARRTTPNLERIAAEGFLFETAYSPSACTAPSHSTLFTGLYPYSHGVLRNGHKFADANVSAAERFKELGYKTAAFVSSVVLKAQKGYPQGFDHYTYGSAQQRTADVTTYEALQWITSHTADEERAPIFVWVHLMDPHAPYDAPTDFGDPFHYNDMEYASYDQMVARYDTELLFADHHLGRLVDRFEDAGGKDGALIVILGDHGESFLEHGWRGHSTQVYEEMVRVPLVIRWKKHYEMSVVVKQYVGIVDVLPTILGMMGSFPAGTLFHGMDLSALMRGSADFDENRRLFFQRREYGQPGLIKPRRLEEFDRAPEDGVFGEGVYVAGDKYSVRFGKWKYSEASQEDVARELYDLEADPGERSNVARQHREVVDRGSRHIAAWLAMTKSSSSAPQKQELTADDIRELEGLGYIEPEEDDDERKPRGKRRKKMPG